VLERARVGETWSGRRDSFCLVTPNWAIRLRGRNYEGSDPDGFMPRDEIVAYLEGYAASFGAPVREGVEVTAVQRLRHGGFALETSEGNLRADAVVLATGAYQHAHRTAGAATLPPDLLQIDVPDYRNEQALPPGRELVVGSGQSGCQIAEELHEAGREVVLACGKAPWGHAGSAVATPSGGQSSPATPTLPWSPFRARLRDSSRTSRRLDTAAATTSTCERFGRRASPSPATFSAQAAAGCASPTTSRRRSPGAMRATRSSRASFARRRRSGASIHRTSRSPSRSTHAAPRRSTWTGSARLSSPAGSAPTTARGCPGRRPFDELGFPIQRDGASTVIPGLYFVGVDFLRKRKSSLLVGVGEDAAIVAERVAESLERG
jgi:putative flavoprotein involved in K+ transport